MPAFPQNSTGIGVRITLFEAFSVFTHVTAYVLPDPLRGLFLKCLSDFVTSITPPEPFRAEANSSRVGLL